MRTMKKMRKATAFFIMLGMIAAMSGFTSLADTITDDTVTENGTDRTDSSSNTDNTAATTGSDSGKTSDHSVESGSVAANGENTDKGDTVSNNSSDGKKRAGSDSASDNGDDTASNLSTDSGIMLLSDSVSDGGTEEDGENTEDQTAQDTSTSDPVTVSRSEPCQVVETGDGTYLQYKGEFYKVVAQSDNNDITTDSPKLSSTILAIDKGNYDYASMLRNYQDPEDFSAEEGEYQFWYVEPVVDSIVPIYAMSESGDEAYLVSEFRLTDADGNEHYVLCADLATGIVTGAGYTIQNVESAGYYKGDDAVNHIKAIAYNGYFGMESGIGSLENVKQLLAENSELTKEQIDLLTDGMALSATQAALWTYANSGNEDIDKELLADCYIRSQTALNVSVRDLSTDQLLVFKTLYNILINMSPETANEATTTLITENNFASEAAITIKDKTEKKDTKGNDIYNADVSFSLEIGNGLTGDDLVVLVKDTDGNTIAAKRLAGDDSQSGYGTITPVKDEKGNNMYTITDLEIANGVKVTLNLNGTQYLNQGVYLYSAKVYDTTQTVIGIAKGQKTVNLTVDLRFLVEEKEVYADLQVIDDSDPDPIPPTPTPTQPDPTIPVISVGVNPGSEPAGEHDPQPVLDPEYKELFEEDVPLDVRYMIPRTGDDLTLWLTLSVLSGMGLAVTALEERKLKRRQ